MVCMVFQVLFFQGGSSFFKVFSCFFKIFSLLSWFLKVFSGFSRPGHSFHDFSRSFHGPFIGFQWLVIIFMIFNWFLCTSGHIVCCWPKLSPSKDVTTQNARKKNSNPTKKISVCLEWPIWRKKRPNYIWTTKSNPSIEPRNDNDDISLQRRMGVCESHTGAVWQLGRHMKLLTPEAFSRQLIQDFLSFFCPFPLICLFSSVNPRFPTISCDPILWILTILTS